MGFRRFGKRALTKTALVYAVDLLAARPYSQKQLMAKLKQRGYEEEEIDEAIARLLQRHYLDDSDLCCRQCRMYIEERRRSLKAISYKLREKGFASADIENAMAENVKDADVYEYEVCMRLLQGHFRVQSAQLQKCMAYLYRKGFNISPARAAAEDFLAAASEME